MRLSGTPARFAALIGFAFVAVSLFPGGARAATTTFTPNADAYVYSGHPNSNYGPSTELRVENSPGYTSYLRFDVEGTSDSVTGATLRLYAGSSGTFVVQPVADNSWGEGSITYNNAPLPGSAIAESGSMVAGQWISVDVTPLIDGNGLMSIALTTPANSLRKLSSREAVATHTPQLIVQTAGPDDSLVAAAGDIACDPASSSYNGGAGTATACHQLATSNLLLNQGLAAVLALGDNQYTKGTLSAFQTVYSPTWGRVKSLTFPVTGNHEYATAGASGYFDYFDGIGNQTGPAGDRSKGYYSYDLAAWHLIALNSNCARIGGCGSSSPQALWLADDLAAHPSACILAYYHHPNFTSATKPTSPGYTSTTALWQELYAGGADLILNGHDHVYERFGRQDSSGRADPGAGIREFVVGSGGEDHGSFKTPAAANSAVRDSTSFGVLELTLRPDGYDWRFLHDDTSRFTDAGTASCTGPTVDTEPPSVPTSVTAAATSPTSVQVSWRSAVDNDGVAGYRIWRDGVRIGTAPTPPFTDTQAQPGTAYDYRVASYDGVGNFSAKSTAATVTTPAG